MYQFFIQAIGFAGVLLFIISFQTKSNKALYMFQALGSVLFCIQFFLMGQFSGTFSIFLGIVRNLMLSRYEQWSWVRWKGWVWIFCALCVVILVFTWSGPLSLLPFMAIFVGTILYWNNNAQRIRLANLICISPCWLVYDFIVGSWGGILNELITLGSILISIYRYGWAAMGENRFGDEKK